jgi:hypothetical protein
MHQMAAAFSGQPTYFAYAPTSSTSSNSTNTPGKNDNSNNKLKQQTVS